MDWSILPRMMAYMGGNYGEAMEHKPALYSSRICSQDTSIPIRSIW